MSKMYSVGFTLLLLANLSHGAQHGQAARTVAKLLTLSLESFSQPRPTLHHPVGRTTMKIPIRDDCAYTTTNV